MFREALNDKPGLGYRFFGRDRGFIRASVYLGISVYMKSRERSRRVDQIGGILVLCWSLASASMLAETWPVVESIDFYGLREVSEVEVRKVLGIKAGDAVTTSKPDMENRLEQIPGVVKAHLATVCCGESGILLYVGIEESAESRFEFRAPPRSDVELPQEILDTYADFETAFQEAIDKGDNSDDLSQGHSLMAHPAARAAQERFLVHAEQRLKILRRVLRKSVDAGHRAVAAQVIGYAPDKRSVVDDLLYAARDPDEIVRNNAIRALGAIAELAGRRPDLGIRIDPVPGFDMLSSIVWTDRNKATMVLFELTEDRDPELLQQLRERALPSLLEMAGWSNPGHAAGAYFLLGRMAGLSEEEIGSTLIEGQRESVMGGFENSHRANQQGRGLLVSTRELNPWSARYPVTMRFSNRSVGVKWVKWSIEFE